MRSLRLVLFAGLAVLAGRPAALASVAPRSDADARSSARAHRESHEAEILAEFRELLALPNLATDSENIARNAVWIAEKLRARGLDARLLDGQGGPPAVYGELKTAGATRTLLIYAHYDGQPVDPSRWTSPPWEPTLRDGPLPSGRVVSFPEPGQKVGAEARIYARSASDDKAPVIALLSALDALKAGSRKPAVNLKVLFEGEEEAGSTHLGRILEVNRELLAGDLWLLCDGPVHQSRRPQVYFGARGVMGLELTVYGPSRPLHSGHYGNWAPNPNVTLVQLLSRMRDREGRILIPGLLDDVVPPTTAEREAISRLPAVDAGLRHELALGRTEGGNLTLAEQLLLPALNLRGLDGGPVGERAANVIPTRARASIDFRLVPRQRPERVREAVESFLKQEGFHVVSDEPDAETLEAHPLVVRAHWEAGYPAARTPLDSPLANQAVAALTAGFSQPLVVQPTVGGSVPMYLFVEVLKTPVLILPVANHDNNQHAADENLRLQNLWDAIEAYATLLTAW